MLVGALTVLLVAALLQLALALHVRNVLTDSAAEGARLAALADVADSAGADRTRELIATGLSPGFDAQVTASHVVVGGIAVVEVRVSADLPLIGFLGPSDTLVVAGRAVDEASL